ncbi:MAG: class I SAM-dependent methyltransferase [Pyrinomonadaceae bacterium]|jgi:SAM-dependent methyltransferase|nr:class I SAM-dependent methyltransferase [Pyrinomonadaceae bacterium]
MGKGISNVLTCRICGNCAGNILHIVREMFLGTRNSFEYIECSHCGTLQIYKVPELKSYYPASYYSFQPANEPMGQSPATLPARLKKRVGAFLRRSSADYYCKRNATGVRHNLLGRYVAENMRRMTVGFPEYLKDTALYLSLNLNSKILDVGCGSGTTLLSLREFGFTNLIGVDPFLETAITYGNGVRILRAELDELEAGFDLIIASHSLEHVPEPRHALQQISRLLKKGQWAIIRIPLVGHAWERYRTAWVALDAPRHLFIFSRQTFSNLAAEAGFEVAEVAFDSTAVQFWGSEQYLLDIPLMDERSYFVNPQNSIFSAQQITEFARKATELNKRGEGDQAIFYLRKPSD